MRRYDNFFPERFSYMLYLLRIEKRKNSTDFERKPIIRRGGGVNGVLFSVSKRPNLLYIIRIPL